MARSAVIASSQPKTASPRVTARSTIEHELKLTVDDRFRLPHLPGIHLPSRLLTSTYYDTTRYDLAQAGITLRHRLEQRIRKWQLKLPLIDDRQEVELVDSRPVPPAFFLELLMVHLDHYPLLPVATLRTRRTGVRVQGERGPIADVTIDHVHALKNGTVSQRFRELEIEQLDGEDTTLRDLERQLVRAGAEEHDGRPKLFRALSLPAPDAGFPPPDAPVVEQVASALARHLRWLTAHDPGTRLGREPESLHQMRVATRQLRAVLRTAAPLLEPDWAGSLGKELAWLGRALGPARDLDVQLAYFRDEASRLDARDRAPLIRFVAHLEAQREQVQGTLVSELKSRRYLDLIGRLRAAAQNPAVVESAVTLQDLARREYKKLRKAIRRAGPSPGTAAVHKIRIKTKRARYAAELARPAAGKQAERFIKQARIVQDVLGMHQDAVQAEAHVRAFLKHTTSLRAAFVGGRMVERQRERRKQARKKMGALLKRLVKRGKQAWNSSPS